MLRSRSVLLLLLIFVLMFEAVGAWSRPASMPTPVAAQAPQAMPCHRIADDTAAPSSRKDTSVPATAGHCDCINGGHAVMAEVHLLDALPPGVAHPAPSCEMPPAPRLRAELRPPISV